MTSLWSGMCVIWTAMSSLLRFSRNVVNFLLFTYLLNPYTMSDYPENILSITEIRSSYNSSYSELGFRS